MFDMVGPSILPLLLKSIGCLLISSGIFQGKRNQFAWNLKCTYCLFCTLWGRYQEMNYHTSLQVNSFIVYQLGMHPRFFKGKKERKNRGEKRNKKDVLIISSIVVTPKHCQCEHIFCQEAVIFIDSLSGCVWIAKTPLVDGLHGFLIIDRCFNVGVD